MRFDAHVANVQKKVSSLLFLLLEHAGYGLEHIKKIYQSLIMYCSVVSGGVNNNILAKLESILKIWTITWLRVYLPFDAPFR